MRCAFVLTRYSGSHSRFTSSPCVPPALCDSHALPATVAVCGCMCDSVTVCDCVRLWPCVCPPGRSVRECASVGARQEALVSPDNWSTAVLELREVDRESSPTAMLQALVATARAIFHTVRVPLWSGDCSLRVRVNPFRSMRLSGGADKSTSDG